MPFTIGCIGTSENAEKATVFNSFGETKIGFGRRARIELRGSLRFPALRKHVGRTSFQTATDTWLDTSTGRFPFCPLRAARHAVGRFKLSSFLYLLIHVRRRTGIPITQSRACDCATKRLEEMIYVIRNSSAARSWNRRSCATRRVWEYEDASDRLF
jgi:hypothetical protein